MELVGLSVDQAPPISAPLRFFLTAPLFGILVGVLLFFSDATLLMNRYSMDTIIVTHTITIGLFSFIMFGSLTQMLPVLASVKIPSVKLVTTIVHFLLVIGLLGMIFGLKLGIDILVSVAYTTLGSGFMIMIFSIAYAIKGVGNFTATIRAMVVSLAFAFFIALMGLLLLYEYASKDISEYHIILANIHSVWAVFGFCGVLIIGVAFQVLPMFYVAPKFKQFCKKRVVYLITFGLLIWMVLTLYFEAYTLYAKLWIGMFFWAFSTTVWLKLNRRKRAISDVTVWYWRSASLFLTLGIFLWIYDEFFKHEYIVMVGILIGGGFILSIMIGMLYKIVPFLVWFHLNGMGYMSIPTVNEMIDKDLAKIQFVLLLLALIGFVFAFYMPQILAPSATLFTVSMMLLEYNLLSPILIYIKTKKGKPDFDMSAFAIN